MTNYQAKGIFTFLYIHKSSQNTNEDQKNVSCSYNRRKVSLHDKTKSRLKLRAVSCDTMTKKSMRETNGNQE